jgi:triosephosphate isomerase (TIM)
MMPRTIIAGNWKMNTVFEQAVALAISVVEEVGAVDDVETVLIPPFPWIVPVADAVAGSGLAVGAQNCYIEPGGAYTGEVSAEMLATHCQYVIAGHSERRHVLGETDGIIAKKVRAIQRAGLSPILCVGETLDERESGHATNVVTRQLTTALQGLDSVAIGGVVVAYEPVWAIGTGRAAEPEDAQQMAAQIRETLADLAGGRTASEVTIQYGGSVKGSNARAFLELPDINGALVGGASLDAGEFAAIIRHAR